MGSKCPTVKAAAAFRQSNISAVEVEASTGKVRVTAGEVKASTTAVDVVPAVTGQPAPSSPGHPPWPTRPAHTSNPGQPTPNNKLALILLLCCHFPVSFTASASSGSVGLCIYITIYIHSDFCNLIRHLLD